MKTPLLLTFCSLLLSSTGLQAALVWHEEFPDDEDGAASDRDITIPGDGSNGTIMDVTGNVSYVSNSIVITPDGGSDRIEMESNVGALAGNFTFDASRTVQDPPPPPNVDPSLNPSLFVQMVEGPTRSTNGAPVDNFSDTLNMSNISTPTAINYFFNVSGSEIDYIAPDGSSVTLANNAYELWIGNNKSGGNNQDNSGQGQGAPTAGVDTLVLQTFNAQRGGIYTFDNMSFNTIETASVPDGGSTLALLSLALGGMASRKFLRRS